MVVEDVGSSQGEFVTQVAGAGEREFSRNPRDVPVEKLERSEEKARLENPESVRIETACAAADLGVQSSVLCRDFIKDGEKRPMPAECATIVTEYKSISLFTCIHVTATSLCLDANEERPMRSGHEQFSTGVESEGQICLKKAIVRRCLAPLPKGRDCHERSPLFKC